MKLFITFLLVFLSSISNAAWRENVNRINSTLQVSRYNSIASQYLPTPTSVIALKMGGIETLGIEPKNANSMYFSIDYVDDYLAAISKYIEWQELATNNGDSFKKQISEAKTKGYEGDACSDCGNFTLVRNGTCLKCDTCGNTTGCS